MAFRTMSKATATFLVLSLLSAVDGQWLSPEYKNFFSRPLPVPDIAKPYRLVKYT
jgi:hypothetical protein